MKRKKNKKRTEQNTEHNDDDKIDAEFYVTGEDPWEDNNKAVREFIKQRPLYERLSDEVSYTLKTRLEQNCIQFASITHRAKSLESFLGKLYRKSYESPRTPAKSVICESVVCLYQDDLPSIETIIARDFEIVERVDKLNDKAANQFGYGAMHFVVTIGGKSAGARYDEINNLKCEIQTRTVLQDAWAIIQHHMVYKNENDVPSSIQRSLNRLAGLFEVADEQYVQIRLKHQRYLEQIQAKRDFAEFLENEVNVDTLREYLIRKFPTLPDEGFNLGSLLSQISHYGTLSPVNELVDKTAIARDACLTESKLAPTRELMLLISISILTILQVSRVGGKKEDLMAKWNPKSDSQKAMLAAAFRNLHLVDPTIDATQMPEVMRKAKR